MKTAFIVTLLVLAPLLAFSAHRAVPASSTTASHPVPAKGTTITLTQDFFPCGTTPAALESATAILSRDGWGRSYSRETVKTNSVTLGYGELVKVIDSKAGMTQIQVLGRFDTGNGIESFENDSVGRVCWVFSDKLRKAR